MEGTLVFQILMMSVIFLSLLAGITNADAQLTRGQRPDG
jgi:hypothetical protein